MAEPKTDTLEDALDAKYNLPLKVRDWIVIHNVLVSGSYRLGDAPIIGAIVNQIENFIPLEDIAKKQREAQKVQTDKVITK